MSQYIGLMESQKKDILKSFKETEMHKELKILFERLYPVNVNVYITHGNQENGKDLVIMLKDPLRGTINTSLVVKMDKLSGSAIDKAAIEIQHQVMQSFETETHIKENGAKVKSDRVLILIFGHISNDGEEKLHSYLTQYKNRYEIYSIDRITDLFTDNYIEVFFGASGLEALTKKYDELNDKLRIKNVLMEESFIEPNLKSYESSRNELLPLLTSSDIKKNKAKIAENIFGKKVTISTIVDKYINHPKFIYIEGDAGSGKSVLTFKMIQYIIDKNIKELTSSVRSAPQHIMAPILFSATELKNSKIDKLEEMIANYYAESAIKIEPNILIVDGIDEVKNDDKWGIISKCEEYCLGKIPLLITGRKNAETKKTLHHYEFYELLPVEKSQVIEYFKKMFNKDDLLLDSILSGIETLEHQIPLYPMALSLLIEIIKKQQEVPASISELYNRYFEMTLGKNAANDKIDVFFGYLIKKDFLQSLAYNIFFKSGNSEIKRSIFDEYTTQYVSSHSDISSKTDFLEDLQRVGILRIEDKKVKFSHKSFLDYFIASYFDDRSYELVESNEFDMIYELYHTSLWEDVTCFYFGIKKRATQDQMNKIIESGKKYHSDDSIMHSLGIFMLGRLVQYAWHSESDDIRYAIEVASSETIELKDKYYQSLVDDFGFELPKIVADASMLHITNLSFSSVFLNPDIKYLIEKKFAVLSTKEKLTDDELSFVFFSMLHTLNNIKKLPSVEVENNLKFLINIQEKIDPEYALSMFALFSIFINKKSVVIDEKLKDEIELKNKKLKKRYKEHSAKIFSFKRTDTSASLNELNRKKLNIK